MTWRVPLVQITAAVGAGGLATAGPPAAGALGAEAVGTTVSPVEPLAGWDTDALAGADADEDEDVDALAGAEVDEDADADAGALAPETGTNGSCDVI
jgi:hypothetical protein